MSSGASPDELGAFLTARRADLSPQTVGLPESGGRRRVRGLRREEVAALAAISTDYYTRLEQGRMHASAPVPNTLARVLHLDDDQRTYMFQFAARLSDRPARRTAQKARPRLQRLLDDLATTPGIVLGRRLDTRAESARVSSSRRFLEYPGEASKLYTPGFHRPGNAGAVCRLEERRPHLRGSAAHGGGPRSGQSATHLARQRAVGPGQ